MPIVEEEPRFWIDDNIDYDILLDGQPTNYVGLVDEEAGGHIAYGAMSNIAGLQEMLNDAATPTTKGWPTKRGRHE